MTDQYLSTVQLPKRMTGYAALAAEAPRYMDECLYSRTGMGNVRGSNEKGGGVGAQMEILPPPLKVNGVA